MAGRSLAYRVALLQILLQGTALANMFDNAASAPLTSLYLSLLTGDPGTSNDQTVNETTYGSYARLAILRSAGGWTINAATAIAVPTATLQFVAPTSGSGTITYVGLGKSISGAGYLFWSGTVSPNIILTVGTAPQLTTASTITES